MKIFIYEPISIYVKDKNTKQIRLKKPHEFPEGVYSTKDRLTGEYGLFNSAVSAVWETIEFSDRVIDTVIFRGWWKNPDTQNWELV